MNLHWISSKVNIFCLTPAYVVLKGSRMVLEVASSDPFSLTGETGNPNVWPISSSKIFSIVLMKSEGTVLADSMTSMVMSGAETFILFLWTRFPSVWRRK